MADLHLVPVVKPGVADVLAVDAHPARAQKIDDPDPLGRANHAAMIVRDARINQPDTAIRGAADERKTFRQHRTRLPQQTVREDQDRCRFLVGFPAGNA